MRIVGDYLSIKLFEVVWQNPPASASSQHCKQLTGASKIRSK